jgi:RNA recognition motif-containing protein
MDEELIPTAIVIKNIPFAVKKEQLVQLMTDLRLPLPYAFNYHFDNGVFRGLAFANFTTADETAQVIDTMNHFELHGRKLRVEYKKMLPLAERERIEREKRERRGQLIEQHQPMGGSLTTQQSYSSLNSHVPAQSPSPVSGQASKLSKLHKLV